MAQPQLARTTCSVCDGWYDSERALSDHMQTAHRRFIFEQSTFRHGGTQPAGIKNQLSISKEEWAILSVALRNSIKDRFDSDELDTIERFILLASQGSVFDHLCR
jgi:hypothetical protein